MTKKVVRLIFGAALLTVLGASVCAAQGREELVINLIAVNALDRDMPNKEIKYFLPKELEPDDVLDTGDLKMDYDVDEGSYYVHGTQDFAAKESKQYKIRVKDVWYIKNEEISVLKAQLDQSLSLLKDEKVYPAAQKARDKITADLDFIMAQQANYSEKIDRRIEEYRAYVRQMNIIRDKVFDEHYLQDVAEAEMKLDLSGTIKFMLEVKNPSDEKAKTVTEKHYLPEEIRAEDVVESQGFDVRFDEEENRAYLTKEEEFAPGETKTYSVVIRDIWKFAVDKLDYLLTLSKSATDELQGSEYEEGANFLHERIMNNVKEIRDSQGQELSIKKHIGLFRVNEGRFAQAKDDLQKIEKMLAIMRAKKLAQMEAGTVKNVLQRMRALRGLAALSEALFKKGISVTMTWRIIFGTLGFVGFFTTLHFIIWARRSRTMGEELSEGEGTITTVPKPGEDKDEDEA